MKTSIALVLSFVFTHQVFAQNIDHNVTSPANFFQQRLEAIELAYNSQWEESAAILKDLLEQYKYDSDLYYLMGICSYETGKYEEAITFLKYSRCGGTNPPADFP